MQTNNSVKPAAFLRGAIGSGRQVDAPLAVPLRISALGEGWTPFRLRILDPATLEDRSMSSDEGVRLTGVGCL